MKRIALLLVAAVAALTACQDKDDPPPDPVAAAPAPAQPTILDDQLKVMDKARAVEQDVIDSQKKTAEAMKEAEGG